METPTQEEIQNSISAAFDSVNLINNLKELSSLTEEEQKRLDRNVRHLEIMLEKDWFSSNLTIEQETEIYFATDLE